MEEREEKLSKAREKLDRFRKKKNKPVPVSGAGEEEQSTASSPLNTPAEAEDPQQQPQQEETPVTEQQQPPAPEPVVTPGSAPSPQHQEADLLSSSQPPVSSSSASSPFELLGDPPPLPQHPGAGAGAGDQGLAAYFGSSSAASSGYSDPSLQMDLTGPSVDPEDSPVGGGGPAEAVVQVDDKLTSASASDHGYSLYFAGGTALVEAEKKVLSLQSEVESEKVKRIELEEELERFKMDKDRMETLLVAKSAEVENLQNTEMATLKSELTAKSQTIEILVAERSELQVSNQNFSIQNQNLQQQKSSLEQTVGQLTSACAELQQQAEAASGDSREEEVAALQQSAAARAQECGELRTKLQLLTSQHDQLQLQHSDTSSQLEMCQVHLTQLRGAGHTQLVRERDQEVERLGAELRGVRGELQEAAAQVTGLARERDQLAEQYRSYSRDLAHQAERLGEQLAKYQQENARLVTREAGLVQHVTSLETQLQGYLKEGRNVTEEELCRMKERVVTLETDLRFSKDEKDKLQEMLEDRGVQVDEMVSRLGMKDNEIMELRLLVSGLETTVDMLKTTSQTSGRDAAQLVAACQSDKVAASRAMQQNQSLKERLEELQGALVSLTNSKADIMDQLDTATRKLSSYSTVEAEIAARNEAAKEKDMQINNLRNQVKHLNEELQRRPTPDPSSAQGPGTGAQQQASAELEQAREMIRSLNSQNSELRSKLEVLSANTRECSETRSNSSASSGTEESDNITNRDAIVETSYSESSSGESFEDIKSDKETHTAAPSSDSFVNVAHDNEIENVEQTIISTTDLPFSPGQLNMSSFQSLEARFIQAMEQIAALSLDKEQLEHLVDRLQDETETIGDYVVMYQHQRHQHKLRLAEKEEQLAQLGRDREQLRGKLASLQEMVTSLMARGTQPDAAPARTVEVGEDALAATSVSETMRAECERDTEREKILELIADIGTGSEHMIAACSDQFQPWFWETSPHKVMTV